MKQIIRIVLELCNINPKKLTIMYSTTRENKYATISNDKYSIVVTHHEPNTYGDVGITTIGVKDVKTDLWTGYDYLGKTSSGAYIGELMDLCNQFFK